MEKEKKKWNTVTGKRKVRRNVILLLLSVFLVLNLCALFLWNRTPQVKALTIPNDYGAGYNDSLLTALEVNEQYEGIVCVEKGTRYNLVFDENNNGLVTLARFSQNSSFAGYTFEINYGASVPLGINYDENGNPVSDGSFFGIGNENYPFKGELAIGGHSDTPLTMQGNGWRYFFNNLSNEASVTSNGKQLYSSYASSTPQGTDMFVFCRTLTVTSNSPLVIDGFRFGSAEGTGDSGAYVQNDGAAALFAASVVSGGGTDLSVDFTKSLTSGRYRVESANEDAAGLIATLNAGVKVTLLLPDSFTCEASSDGSQKNVGLLVGSNYGSVSVAGNDQLTLKGSLDCMGSCGVIGANEISQSKLIFDRPILVSEVQATGLRAGGIVGTCKGGVDFNQDLQIDHCTFTSVSNGSEGRLGGAIGSIDYKEVKIALAQEKKIILTGNSFSVSDGCVVGGYIGYWASVDATVENVSVKSSTFTMNDKSVSLGGLVGKLVADGNITFRLQTAMDVSVKGMSTGNCGGVIGNLSSNLGDPLSKTIRIEGDGTCSVTNTVSNGKSAKVGGVVGYIEKPCYVYVTNLTLNNNIYNALSYSRFNYAADLVGHIAAKGVLDVGNLTLTEKNGSVLVGTTERGSVVRLNGTITDNSSEVRNIVYQQNCSLIYKEEGCVYIAAASLYNDIGNYGQVLRDDVLHIFSLTDEHRVSVASPLDASGDISLGSAADFAKFSVTLYTEGEISGVSGITSENYATLLSKYINITGDVSLENTGVEQLTPAYKGDKPYKGKVNGREHTVTLAIGQSLSGNNNGVKVKWQGIAYAINNARKWFGLFATTENVTVSNLKIAGTIKTERFTDLEGYIGGLCGIASNGLTVSGCEFSVKEEITEGYSTASYSFYAGGAVGKIDNASTLSVTGSTFSPTINDSSVYRAEYTETNYAWGGLCGYAKYSGSNTIDFTNNVIKTKLTKSGEYKSLRTGGLVGALECTKYAEVDLGGTQASGVSLATTKATGSAGGLLGYQFKNCFINNLNGSYQGSVEAGSASLGGLIHTLTGRMSVQSNFALNGSVLTAKSSGEKCGLLLSNGKNALVSVECAASGFDVTAENFDLFVGENIESKSSVGVAESGGILTIETGAGLGKVPDVSDWHALINARPNTGELTRYYFNVLGMQNKENVDENISDAEELLYWHLYDYTDGNLIEGVKLKTPVNNVGSVTADIDMSGYSFYPTKKESVIVDFSDKPLTFALPSVSYGQCYGMQAGLLSDVTARTNDATVELKNLKLSGRVVNLGDYGSGGLICGTVFGTQRGGDKYTVNLTVESITLNDLYVKDGESGYRPLLINTLGSYVRATISGIYQDYASQTTAASSLIGNGGIKEQSGDPSSYINVTFNNIVLKGQDSIFTRATLFDNVQYVNGTGSCIYNFTFDEDWGTGRHSVTYGAELYFDDEQQRYFDREIFVNPESEPGADSLLYAGFQTYLPYVYIGFDKSMGTTNRLLSVNRKGADFIKGFGTYKNPYIIETVKQLVDLSKWLSGTAVFNDDWKINFPRGKWSSLSGLDLTGYYVVQAKDGKLVRQDDTSSVLTQEVLLQYLSGAYYEIAETLFLTADYVGLGSVAYPFHGVVYGAGKSVTLSAPRSAITSAGYGFINVANGCAVYGLTIGYNDTIALSEDGLNKNSSATSAADSTTLTTSLPYFGGAIAWVVGGDNLLQKVTVSVNGGVTGANHSVFGTYVGLISGGGVLFDKLGAVNANASCTDSKLYHNNYVGRVLQGYAIAVDGNEYNNGKDIPALAYTGDYLIPSVEKSAFKAHSGGYVGNTFSLGTAEELLFFSLAINSGAFAGSNGYAYGQSSLSRFGDYSHVGGSVNGITNGRYTDDTKKLSVLAAYFGMSTPTDLRNTAISVNLTDGAYDMSAYGNAFRGISGIYNNATVYKIQSFGAASGKKTITVNMNMPQYASLTASTNTTGDVYDQDAITYYGLIGRTDSAIAFKNIVLRGNIRASAIDYATNAIYDLNKAPKRYVGGLIGYMGNNITVSNVSMESMNVVSAGYAGGFVGYQSAGTFQVNNAVNDILTEVLVKGQRSSGGCVGYIASGTATVNGFAIADSTVEAVVRYPEMENRQVLSVGGVVGAISGSVTLTMRNCLVKKTAVIFYSNYYGSNSEYIAAGGLLGHADQSTNVNVKCDYCTVDGCVVYALGSFSNNDAFPYEQTSKDNKPGGFVNSTSKTAVANLSQDTRNNLIYNGEKQQSVTILAWFLSQNGTKSLYSIGLAGGLIGALRTKAELTNCTVTAKSAPMAIASLNNTGGIVSEQRYVGSLKLENCSVKTEGHDLFIVGDPRAAGVMAYSNKADNDGYTLNNVSVTGTAENPVRIASMLYSGANDAGGLFGDVLSFVNATNIRVSYCILAGYRSAGLCSTVGANGTFKNVHVDHNLLYNRDRYATGGLFGYYNSGTMTVEGAYIGENTMIGCNYAGALAGNVLSGTINAKYVISEKNALYKGNQSADFTFVARSLEPTTDFSDLYTTNKNTTNLGLVCGANAGTVNVRAISYAPPATVTTNKNFGSGTGTVVYVAYGAETPYKAGGYTTEYSEKTPQQVAIEAQKLTFNIDGKDTPLYGDSITVGTPQELQTFGDEKKWPSALSQTAGYTVSSLQEKVAGVTINQNLQLLCLSDNTDATMREYLNLLTGGGFASLVALNDSNFTIASDRYTVDNDGRLTLLSAGKGSIVYQDKKFKVGVYDNLEGENKTLTLLTLTFKDPNNNNQGFYKMHVAVYYYRAVDLKSFVVPVEGEEYYLPTFLQKNVPENGSIQLNVSFGSPFTLYVEYDYNDVAMKLEGISNFNKRIELVGENGMSNESARIERGTALLLIDLNSENAAGYSFYTLVLTEAQRFIEFKDFKNGEQGFVHIDLTTIGQIGKKIEDRICKDVDDKEGCIYTEKYLMVVFPVDSNEKKVYNMKAVIDEAQRQEKNIVVNHRSAVFGQIAVWEEPKMVINSEYINSTEAGQFSNLPTETMQMQVTSQIFYPDGYVGALQSQGGAIYETHTLQIRDSLNKYVELPTRTMVTVEYKDGTPIYEKVLDASSSQIRFSIGNVLHLHATEKTYTIKFDFSLVNNNDFYQAFSETSSTEYTLMDSMYLSSSEGTLGIGPQSTEKIFIVKRVSKVKLAVVPKDNQYLGINLAQSDEKTNSGIINFTVSARFDFLDGKKFHRVEISFSLKKKVYDSGKYTYVDLTAEEAGIWTVYKGETAVTGDTLQIQNQEGVAEYTLRVDKEHAKLDLTNYRLMVHLTATADDGSIVTADEDFVFLICRIETEPGL